MDELFKAVDEPGWDKEFTVTEEWYKTKEWTTDQEIEFKNWLLMFLIKNLKMHPKMAESTANWFVFSYGWKIKEGY